jgi:hypothetical protein
MIVAPLIALAAPSAFALEPARPAPLLVSVAYGEEDEEEEDSDSAARRKPRATVEDERTIREIVRGFYARANMGAAAYLLNFGNKGNGTAVSAGTVVALSVGQDFVDTEKQSMAWEVGFVQGIHNGLAWELQAGLCDYNGGAAGGYPCTEGDLRTYSLQAAYEFSAYPVRRVGIGFRAGGGALYSPHLVESVGYTEDVLPAFGAEPGIQGSIHPYGFAGPTIEYYTKLSHFSVGIDADVFYAVGWDLGLNASAALKYTF